MNRNSYPLTLMLMLTPPALLAAVQDFSPPAQEEQLPQAMHSAMEVLPSITVGQEQGTIIGQDNRALQAAVDYIAGLGGGLVLIGPGDFLMEDSLHLRAHVTVRGTPGKTVLRKAPATVSPLALDGDFGEQQITLVDPAGFAVGQGVAVWDSQSGGFHTTVGRITGQRGSTFAITHPLMSDCMVHNQAQAATVFPVVSGYHIEGARVENLVIEGNRTSNPHLNGCRGAGIFLYRAFGTVIKDCVVRDYNGDGISFQQSNDVVVENCVCENNAFLGLHPGSGSQRPRIRACVARNNGTDGLFLCWRVRHGIFKDNVLEKNQRFGISIGHKDSDNLLQGNIVRQNQQHGVFFRNESLGMAAHRNRLLDNVIEDNTGAGICIRGHTNDLVFENNVIRETRPTANQTQTIGIRIEEHVGKVTLENNIIEAKQKIEDKRTNKTQE